MIGQKGNFARLFSEQKYLHNLIYMIKLNLYNITKSESSSFYNVCKTLLYLIGTMLRYGSLLIDNFYFIRL